MATTKDFTGVSGTELTTYDSNFTQVAIQDSEPELDGSGALTPSVVWSRWLGYYDNTTSSYQKATISAKLMEDGSTPLLTSPIVRCSSGVGGYYLQYSSDGTTVSGFNLRRLDDTSNQTWLVNLTTIASAAAASFIDYSIEAEDVAGDVKLTVTVDGNSEVYTDSSAGKLLTGQPGLQITSEGVVVNEITSFTTEDLGAAGVIDVDHILTGISLYEPGVELDQQLDVDHISTTIAMYEPTGSSDDSNQQLDADFITPGNVTRIYELGVYEAGTYYYSEKALYEPFGFNYDLIESTLNIYEPTAVSGLITADYISTGNELFEPLVYPDQLITAGFIVSNETLYEPTATVPIFDSIAVDFISSTNELYEPAFGSDTEAPNLTLPTATFVSTATCIPTCYTDEDNGTMGYVIVESGVAAPSAAQVLLGQDGNGDAATVSDTKFVTYMGTQTFQIATGLDPHAGYDLYFAHIDDAGNTSAVAGTSFETLGTDNRILNPDIITRLGEVRKSKRKKPIHWDY